MTIARREIVTDGAEGIYHCISRCVRRAFLCGEDPYTGQSFEHRKAWVENRLKLLVNSFAIQICAFAVMSNHLHVVLRTRPDLAATWSDEEAARRWLLVFPKRKTKEGKPLPPSPGEIMALCRDYPGIDVIRRRLGSVSWFMRSLNENIARRANREDCCKGRFWEGRFKCQAILDEAALLACMTYVDLNPVRAGVAMSPETSPHTSAFLRIRARRAQKKGKEIVAESGGKYLSDREGALFNGVGRVEADYWLCPFKDDDGHALLELNTDQYLDMLDWTGRQLRENKNSIPEHYKPILDRLMVDSEKWLDTITSFGRTFYRAAGREKNMRRAAGSIGLKWFKGLRAGRRSFT